MVKLTPLSNWLNDAPEQIVAVHKETRVTTVDFLNRVRAWIDVLEQHQVKGGKWAVYHQDTFEFLAILFALWQLKQTACIPGDNRPGTVNRLSDYVVGFIGEFPSIDTALDIDITIPTRKRKWLTLASDFIALEIYTSGSTGQPKPITKTIGQLDNESHSLAFLWPTKPDCIVLATVSHQHLYGMTFRLFLPFILGQAFGRKLCNYSEDIYYHANYYSSFLLVSSPSHLGRLSSQINWAELGERCQFILSSSAPLLRADSLKVSALWNTSVCEIYGSSETGAIAWRSQKKDSADAKWQALPSTQLSLTEDGVLQLSSSFHGSNEPMILADRVLFDDDGMFSLLGREDSVVKIEGKRVSLTNIEQLLVKNPLIEGLKAIVLERKRIEVALVIKLTAKGFNALNQLGRKDLISQFKSCLSNEFEAVVLPRRWRFVKDLPYNQQGKLPMEDLIALFEKNAVNMGEAV